MLIAFETLLSKTKEYIYFLKYGLCLFIKIFDESKNSKASELLSFPNAITPEKYFDTFLWSKLSELVLLE